MVELVTRELDASREHGLASQQACFTQVYAFLVEASRDPGHDLSWGWQVLGATLYNEQAAVLSAKKTFANKKAGTSDDGGIGAGSRPPRRPSARTAATRAARGRRATARKRKVTPASGTTNHERRIHVRQHSVCRLLSERSQRSGWECVKLLR